MDKAANGVVMELCKSGTSDSSLKQGRDLWIVKLSTEEGIGPKCLLHKWTCFALFQLPFISFGLFTPCHATQLTQIFLGYQLIFILFCYLLVWCQAWSVNFEYYHDSSEYIWGKQCYSLKQKSLLTKLSNVALAMLAFPFSKNQTHKDKALIQDLSCTVCSLKSGSQGCSRKNYDWGNVHDS